MSSTYKWDGVLVNSTEIASIGSIMYSSYTVWLLITGVILLLAMVVTIVISMGTNQNNNSTKGLTSSTFIR
jgi:NADH:ubiquinone oxidoreductase subunit 6 (subunit J)